MSEHDAVAKTAKPQTVNTLTHDLKRLGVTPGSTVLVHSSLSALGWVCGGPVAVIYALESALGNDGTLVMPTHSSDLSDPDEWRNPAVPAAWRPTIRETMPAYDPDLTPTRAMGVIPETFLKRRGVLRSSHPQYSFAAFGPSASFIIEDHSLDNGFGENSPLSRLYDLNADILLLGAEYKCNTSFHLAEHRANWPSKAVRLNAAPMMTGEGRQWATFSDIRFDDSDFETIGSAMEQAGIVRAGRAGCAVARLISARACVDFAVEWIEANRH